MKKLIAVLYIAFPMACCMGQAASPAGSALSNDARQLSKRFPPEVIASTETPGKIKLAGRYCILPGADRKTITVKRCKPAVNTVHLVRGIDR